MRFKFSWTTTLICLVLVCGMLRASHWQWQRYQWKQDYIRDMQARLEMPVIELHEMLKDSPRDWSELTYRRVKVRGTYDFAHEMVLRNRRLGDTAGVHALTPLLLSDAAEGQAIIVDRGFIPLSQADKAARIAFHKDPNASFVGLIKETAPPKFLAPSDPPSGPGHTWVDAWLRVDLKSMSMQIPYPIPPVYLEIVETDNTKAIEAQIVNSKSGRDEMFFLPGKENKLGGIQDEPNLAYPVPIFDTVIPPGRHFGYIFEWAAMAVMTVLAGVVLQLRK